MSKTFSNGIEYESVCKELSNSESKDYSMCPICNKTYYDRPAISRKDNKTKICCKCGILEALAELAKYNKK